MHKYMQEIFLQNPSDLSNTHTHTHTFNITVHLVAYKSIYTRSLLEK